MSDAVKDTLRPSGAFMYASHVSSLTRPSWAAGAGGRLQGVACRMAVGGGLREWWKRERRCQGHPQALGRLHVRQPCIVAHPPIMGRWGWRQASGGGVPDGGGGKDSGSGGSVSDAVKDTLRPSGAFMYASHVSSLTRPSWAAWAGGRLQMGPAFGHPRPGDSCPPSTSH